MPTYEQEMLKAARDVARLQTRKRFLRRELKRVDKDLKHAKKFLRALVSRDSERRPDIIPSRVFGDGVGRLALTGTDATKTELPE